MFRWCVFVLSFAGVIAPAQAQLLDASAVSGNWRPADGSCKDKSTLFMLDRLLVFPSGEPALGVTWQDAPEPTVESTSKRAIAWISLIGESRGTYNDQAQSYDVRFVYDGGERAHIETPETHIWMTRCPGTQLTVEMPDMALAYIDHLGFGTDYAQGGIKEGVVEEGVVTERTPVSQTTDQATGVSPQRFAGEAEALNRAVLQQSSVRMDDEGDGPDREPEMADRQAETETPPAVARRVEHRADRSPRAAAAVTRDFAEEGYEVKAVMAAAEATADNADFLNSVSLSISSPVADGQAHPMMPEVDSAAPAKTAQTPAMPDEKDEPSAPDHAALDKGAAGDVEPAGPAAPVQAAPASGAIDAEDMAQAPQGDEAAAADDVPELRLASVAETAVAYIAPMVPDRDSPPASHETFATLTSSLAGGWYDVDLEEDERRGRASCDGVTVVTADLEGQGSFFFEPVPGIRYGDEAADIRVGEISGFGENTYTAERQLHWTMEEEGGTSLPVMVFDQGPVRSGEQTYKVAFAEREVDGRDQPTIVLEQLTTGYKREYAKCEF